MNGEGINLVLRGSDNVERKSTGAGRKPLCQWNIPRSSSGSFIGRSDALDNIQHKLLDNDIDVQKRYVITGMGGMGKSEICLRLTERVRSQ